MKFEITELSHRSERGLFGTTLEGYDATVKTETGETFGVSQLEGEAPQWGVDSAFGKNGFPYWSHGFGCRVVRVHAVTDEVAAALNARRDALIAQQATAPAAE